MDERILALIVVAVLALGAWTSSKVYRAGLTRSHTPDDALDQIGLPRDGRPVVLGFGGEYCLPCKTQQRPALERLREQAGASLHVREIDALAHAELTQRYGVLTVPTTVVLDGNRKVIAINYGVTTTNKLLEQIEPLLRA